MALSRFWVALFLCSIGYLLVLLFSGRYYAIEFAVNGKKDDPLLQREVYLQQLPPDVQQNLQVAADHKLIVGSEQYIFDNGVVKVYAGKQAADGILPTCKNTIIDLLLPLIAYLSFFSGILQLLIDSGAAERVAKLLSPVFVHIFPEVPRGHPSISYMTLNFAANFLGLDSAATPFGLKAMESLQELNQQKDRASNPQIMFMCLHAAGLTLIPTSIISYRAAQHAMNPADVMLPCIITSFVGTIAALVIVGIRQRINLLNGVVVIALGGMVAIIAALLIYLTRLDLISKSHFTGNLSNILLVGLIFAILAYSLWREKQFTLKGTTIFSSFVEGAYNGLAVGRIIFPYILGMLVAISLFRNSGRDACERPDRQCNSHRHSAPIQLRGQSWVPP
jgi:spore maturation protein SpmA